MISLQQDPGDEEGGEAACIALMLGMKLIDAEAEVTVFATLDGIYIADAETYEHRGKRFGHGKSRRDAPVCDTIVDGELEEELLESRLFNFLEFGGKILLCPLCNAVRQPYELVDDRISAGDPIPLLLEAYKVIDF